MELIKIQEENGQTFAVFEKVVQEKKPVTRETLVSEMENLSEEKARLDSEQLKIQARIEDIESKLEIMDEYLNPRSTDEVEEDGEDQSDEESDGETLEE